MDRDLLLGSPFGVRIRSWAASLGVRSLVGSFASQSSILLIGVATGLLAARWLGPVGRGMLAAATVWPLAIATLGTFGMTQAIAVKTGKQPDRAAVIAASALQIGIAQGLFVLLIGVIALSLLAPKLGTSTLLSSFVLLGSMPFMILSGYPGSSFQGLGKLRNFHLLRLFAAFGYLAGLIVIGLLHSVTVLHVVIAQALSYVLVAAVAYIWLFGEFPVVKGQAAERRNLIGYALPAYGAGLSNFLNQRADQLVLSLFVPKAELGYYAVAVTATASLVVLPTSIANVAISRATLARTQLMADEIIRHSVLLAGSLFAFACAGFWLVIPFLITFLFGQAYAPSVAAARILIPGTFFLGIAQVLYGGANSIEKPQIASYAETTSLMVTAAGLTYAVPRWGYIGAAWVSSVAYTVSFLLTVFLLRRTLFPALAKPTAIS